MPDPQPLCADLIELLRRRALTEDSAGEAPVQR